MSKGFLQRTWEQWRGRRAGKRSRPREAQPARLGFDVLEDRRMLSAVLPAASVAQLLSSGHSGAQIKQALVTKTTVTAPVAAPVTTPVAAPVTVPVTPLDTAESPNGPVKLSGSFVSAGVTDIAEMDNDGTWWVEQPSGASFATTIWAQWLPIDHWVKIVAGDFNGDGRTDVAGLTTGGTWIVGISTGASFITSTWAQWSPTGTWTSIQVGNFNGGGRADVAGLSSTGAWVVGLSTGSSFSTSTWAQWSTASAWTSIQVGDFDGSGRTDVAGLNAAGAWVVGVSTGSSFTTSTWAQWSPATTWTSIVAGDFNGDGRTDVAGLSSTGAWVVGVSTGSSFSSSTWAQWSPSATYTSVAVGNFLGNNFADVVGVTSNGALVVGESDGLAFSATGTWATAAGAPFQSVLVGNFTGKTYSDLALLGANRVWTIAVSNGQTFSIVAWTDQYAGAVSVAVTAPPPLATYSSVFFDAVPSSLTTAMELNNSQTFALYIDDFKGVLRGWVAQAEEQSLVTDQQFETFLAAKLNAYLPVCLSGLQSIHPGLTTEQYQLLMIMNLVNSYYTFDSTADVSTFAALLQLTTGDCSEFATLTAALANTIGIGATREGYDFNYNTAYGQFFAGHQIVLADGMWIDAETDIALIMNPATITSIAPNSRLATIVQTNSLLGFYSWCLQPQVRSMEIAQGQDGGDIAYYYYWYLAGIGQGQFSVTTYPPIQ